MDENNVYLEFKESLKQKPKNKMVSIKMMLPQKYAESMAYVNSKMTPSELGKFMEQKGTGFLRLMNRLANDLKKLEEQDKVETLETLGADEKESTGSATKKDEEKGS